MSVSGRINLITDPMAFFAPIIFGAKAPTGGFARATDFAFVVEMSFLFLGAGFPFSVSVAADGNPANAEFTLPDFPAEFGPIDQVWLRVTHRGRPFYRTEPFPYAHTKKKLEIFAFEPLVPSSDGVTAGQISTGLAGSPLPGDTTLSANSWGLGVVGSSSGVDIEFGIQMIPDTSHNLSVFFDLALNGYNIHVGFPADWCANANDILNNIKSSLQASGSTANNIVSGTITKALEKPPLNLPSTITNKLLDIVSI